MNRTIIGASVAIAAICGIVAVAILSPDSLPLVASVLGPVAAGGAWFAGRGGSGPGPTATAPVALVLMSLMLSACGSSYTLKRGGYRLEPQQGGGHCLVVSGDGDPEVLRACIRDDSLSIHPALAARICAEPTPGEED